MNEDWGTSAELQAVETRRMSGFSIFLQESSSMFTYEKTQELNGNINSSDQEDGLSPAENSLLRKVLRTGLLETNSEVEIQRYNNNCPLQAVKSFEKLSIPKKLLRGIYAMGYNAPSRIQETSLPALLANPPINMIAQAQSGTGKTAAFLVASLSRVIPSEEYPQVLIVLPTYELALQIGEVAKTMALFCPEITFRFAVRGVAVRKNENVKEHVVIGTPGKIIDYVRRFRVFDIEKIRVFVLDEADVMISTQGFQDQCIRIHSMIPRNSGCQMLLFSATYSQEVMNFAEQIIENPVVIRLRREEETLENVKQFYATCPTPEAKYTALQNIYGSLSIGQAIIFCRTKRTAAWLGDKLTKDGHSVGYLSSDLNVTERRDAITSFREGKEKILITTNVCARGIDIEQVTVVVNFDLPVFMDGEADCETYLHRIGRSGRFGKNAAAVTLVSDDIDKKVLKDIEQHYGKTIEPVDYTNFSELERMYS